MIVSSISLACSMCLVLLVSVEPSYIGGPIALGMQEIGSRGQMATYMRLLSNLEQIPSIEERIALWDSFTPETQQNLLEIIDARSKNERTPERSQQERKKNNALCHFKICNMGRRKRFQTQSEEDSLDEQINTSISE